MADKIDGRDRQKANREKKIHRPDSGRKREQRIDQGLRDLARGDFDDIMDELENLNDLWSDED